MKKILNLILALVFFMLISCSDSTEPGDSGDPSNLIGTYNWNVGGNVCTVDLTWDAPDNPTESSYEFKIYRNQHLIANVSKVFTTYTDENCIPGGEYNYVVTADYSSAGESNATNEENVLIDMTEILLNNSSSEKWYAYTGNEYYLTFDYDGTGTLAYYLYGYGFVSTGFYTVNHDTLFISYDTWQGEIVEHTENVIFNDYDSMLYYNRNWERR